MTSARERLEFRCSWCAETRYRICRIYRIPTVAPLYLSRIYRHPIALTQPDRRGEEEEEEEEKRRDGAEREDLCDQGGLQIDDRNGRPYSHFPPPLPHSMDTGSPRTVDRKLDGYDTSLIPAPNHGNTWPKYN